MFGFLFQKFLVLEQDRHVATWCAFNLVQSILPHVFTFALSFDSSQIVRVVNNEKNSLHLSLVKSSQVSRHPKARSNFEKIVCFFLHTFRQLIFFCSFSRRPFSLEWLIALFFPLTRDGHENALEIQFVFVGPRCQCQCHNSCRPLLLSFASSLLGKYIFKNWISFLSNFICLCFHKASPKSNNNQFWQDYDFQKRRQKHTMRAQFVVVLVSPFCQVLSHICT